jgi:hypothetical protein
MKRQNKNWQVEFFVSNGVRTALWRYQHNTRRQRKNILLIHGINGSHFGLMELVKNLIKMNYNPIMLDLPGHGDSDIPDWHDIKNIYKWYNECLTKISQECGEIHKVVAHSFGCYVVDFSNKTIEDITLICPVPTPNKTSKFLANLAEFFLRFRWAVRIYNFVPFSVWRGMLLLGEKTSGRRSRIIYVSKHDANTTIDQRRYQLKILDVINSKDIFANADPKLVIIGRADMLPKERTVTDFSKVFPNSEVKEVRGGHLAPIENAHEIAVLLSA